MDPSQLISLAYVRQSVGTFIDIYHIAQILETLFWVMIVFFVMLLPAEEGVRKRIYKYVRTLFTLLILLSFVLYSFQQGSTKYLYLIFFVAFATYAILKEFFPNFVQAQS